MNRKVIALGGAHLDIIGAPGHELNTGDKNFGSVRFIPGGVAFNIAANLELLGIDVSLITLFCSDFRSEIIRRACSDRGINISESLFLPDGTTPSFMAITDNAGEIRAAISDTGLYESITPGFLSEKINYINGFDLCVLDANLSAEVLEYLICHASIPVFLDPVSLGHAGKLGSWLGRVHTFKPNRREAEFLSGMGLKSAADLRRGGEFFIGKGIKRVFLSMGEEGLYFTDGTTDGRVIPKPGAIVNTIGAGDAVMAGLVYGFINGLPINETAALAAALSSITLETEASVNAALCVELLSGRAGD